MKRIIFTLLFSVVSLAGTWASNQPDAIYRLRRHTVSANADGSLDIRIRKELTILRNRALTGYADKGETFITYNPLLETVVINESYTERADGSRVSTPQNAFIEQLPDACTSCARLNALRELVVVHTALEYGATLVLDYTIHRRSSRYALEVPLLMDCPTERLEIAVPAAWTADRATVALQSEALRTDTHTANGQFHITYDRLPQSNLEPFSFSPVVALALRTGDRPTVPTTTSLPEADKLIASLPNGSPDERAIALCDWVRDNVHRNDIDPALVNFEIAPATETFSSNCGTYADRVVLLAALLRQAGLDAHVVDAATEFANARKELTTLASTEEHPNSQVKLLRRPGQQRNLRVAVSLDGETLYLSPNGEQIHHAEDLLPLSYSEQRLKLHKYEEMEWNASPVGAGYSLATLPDDDVPALLRNPLTTEREHDMLVPLYDLDLTYCYPLPAGTHLASPTGHFTTSKKGFGSVEIDIREQDGKVTIHKTFRNTTQTITPRQYIHFRRIVNAWREYDRLTFKK
ncbi:MAG: DUF3857 domain-containing protein [Bacteroidales bacterium]|nr:DUF3857 domain-containing protein [Bacteroidales bacterium]